MATKGLLSLVDGKKVLLEFEEREKTVRDRMQRIFAYVYIEKENAEKNTRDDEKYLNINIEMVRLGFARYSTAFGKSKYENDFRAAEDEARIKSLGLWRKK